MDKDLTQAGDDKYDDELREKVEEGACSTKNVSGMKSQGCARMDYGHEDGVNILQLFG